MDPYLGEIKLVGFNYAPRGWALCQGQVVSISQNSALFALLGTYYGGNGTTTFALPDLRGRLPVSVGQALGGGNYELGQAGGVESVTLLTSQIPTHIHAITTTTGTQSQSPSGARLADPRSEARGARLYASGSNGFLNSETIALRGNNQSHNNMQPYLVMNYIIATQGIFPSRS